MIVFDCGECKTLNEVPDSEVGKAMSCPKCFLVFTVPERGLTEAIQRLPEAKPASTAVTDAVEGSHHLRGELRVARMLDGVDGDDEALARTGALVGAALGGVLGFVADVAEGRGICVGPFVGMLIGLRAGSLVMDVWLTFRDWRVNE